MKMEIPEILEKQEESLRFTSVSFSLLHKIGETLIEEAGKRGGSVYVMIRVGRYCLCCCYGWYLRKQYPVGKAQGEYC